MDITKVRYSLILLFGLVFVIPSGSFVVATVKACAAFALFYFLPGVFLSRKLLNTCNLLSGSVLAVLVGVCFHIVYVYLLGFCGISFNLYILLIPGVVCAVLADYYNVQLPKNDPREVYLVLAGIIFFVLTYNLAPGEDANGHLMVVTMILEEKSVPSTYTLYPELSLSYHMGFHVIVSEIEYTTGVGTLLSVIGSLFGVFMIFSSCLCVKSFYTEKAGLISGILVGFGVLPPLYYLSYGAYASIVLFVVQPLVIFLLYSKDFSDVPLLSLVLAAGVMSHSSFLLFWIPLLTFLEKYRILIPSFVLSLVLSVPHLVRVQSSYSLQEVVQLYHLWYVPEIFRVQMVAERISVLIFVCGILGFIFLKRREFIFFLVWVLSLLFLALTSLVDVEFPFWFVLFANRLVDCMVIPLTFLASIFVSEIGKKKWYLLLLLIVLPLSPHFYSIPRSSNGPLFPTDSPEFAADQEGIAWLLQNTDESVTILNDWWTGTGSSWITSLGERRLIFPFLYVHDHFLDILDIPEKSRDTLWVSLAPDSEESHRLLTTWGVDYIFLSSYVEDRVKWRRDSWNVAQMMESPNYELVFKKENTYIFKVKKEEWMYTHLFSLAPVEFETNRLKDPHLHESFPINKLIRITYHDSFTGMIQFWSDRGLIAEIPLLNTGEPVTVLLPFGSSLHIKSPQPLPIVHADIVSDFSGYTLGDIGLSPHWTLGEYITLHDQGYIYIFGGKTLTLVYKDTFSGNVDINVLIDGTWAPLKIIERTGDGLTKEVTLTFPEYHVLVIGIKVYGSPFYMDSLTVQ